MVLFARIGLAARLRRHWREGFKNDNPHYPGLLPERSRQRADTARATEAQNAKAGAADTGLRATRRRRAASQQ